ncbi:MAG: outer membrane beta-barrel protein [Bacteroidota bacterium]
MKKNFLFPIVLILFSAAAFSQDIPKMSPGDRFIVSLFSDIWSDLPDDMEPRTINRGVSIEYLQDFPLGTSNFSFAAGLGFTSHNLYSDHWYEWTGDNHNFIPVTSDLEYDNNKLSLNYLMVPLELRFRTRNTAQTFRIHAGVKGGVLINAHNKYVGEQTPNGREFKLKEGKLDNIESFLIGFHGRIGYGRVNLNTFISLTDIFTENDAANASFMSVGLSFVIF